MCIPNSVYFNEEWMVIGTQDGHLALLKEADDQVLIKSIIS